MTYEDALLFIHKTEKFGSKPGLSRIKALLGLLGNPEKACRCIHIAGTNGKGSTTALLSAMLEQAGYKTGMYISPYVTDFRERIRVNGEYIKKEELARQVEALLPLIDTLMKNGHIHPTEFEIITAIAFSYFAKKQCDFVVLETGLGGRFDATNAISSNEAAVITSISYDHMAILGDTLEKIAFEKCGILKKGSFLVTYPEQEREALDMIRLRAKEEGLPLIIPDIGEMSILKREIGKTRFRYKGFESDLSLMGDHQVKNAITAIETIWALQKRGRLSITDDEMARGISACVFEGRLEVLEADKGRPRVVFDGGHNPAGIAALAQAADTYFTGGKLHVMMGMLADKTYDTCIPMIAKRASRYIAVSPRNPRALCEKDNAQAAKKVCADVIAEHDFNKALTLALEGLDKGDTLLICGSLYLIADMRHIVFNRFGIEDRV